MYNYFVVYMNFVTYFLTSCYGQSMKIKEISLFFN